MPKVEAPIVGTEIDTNNPVDSAKNVVLGVVGVAVFITMLAFGSRAGNTLTQAVDGVLGTNASESDGIGFRGEL